MVQVCHHQATQCCLYSFVAVAVVVVLFVCLFVCFHWLRHPQKAQSALSPPHRLLLVNTRERKTRERERWTVGDLCGGESNQV